MTSASLDQGRPGAGHRLPGSTRSWTADDCMLYALGVGAGADVPLRELDLTTENTAGAPLRVLPTFGLVLAASGPEQLADLGATARNVLLVDNTIEILRPIPVAGTVRTTATVVDVTAHRAGDLVAVHGESVLAEDAGPLFRTRSRTLVRRGDPRPTDPSRRRPASPSAPSGPARPIAFRIPLNQALLYRLSGGRNPLHSDPAVAAAAGFATPMLHGRCTLGSVARLLVREICGGDTTALTTLGARMRAPVWPGDQLTLHVRPDDDGRSGTFEVHGADRAGAVLDQGVYRCR